MSNAEMLLEKKDAIGMRSSEDNKKIVIPFSVFLSEADAAWVVAREDKVQLIGAGLNWGAVSELPKITGAVRELQSLWTSERKKQSDADDEWEESEDSVVDHIDYCLHAMEYAYRYDEDLLASVELIKEGEGSADLVQDLNDIAVSGRENEPLFADINFDMAHFDIAAELGVKMADILARKMSSPEMSEIKELRDKGYSWIKEILDELYACGHYVFWKDAERKKLYGSEYKRKMNRKNYLAQKQRESSL